MSIKKAGGPVHGGRPPLATRRPATAGECRCGQDLDVCTRSHCPRCGASLRQD